MKIKYFLFLIISSIIIAVLTNPNTESHKLAVKAKLNTLLGTELKKNNSTNENEWASAGNALGAMFGNVIIEQLTNTMVNSNNYLIFSTTTLTWEGETKTIGFGAFGNVFISKQVEDKLQDKLNSQE